MNGAVDSKSTFDRHMQKILKVLNMSADKLMFYQSTMTKPVTTTVFSQNAPVSQMSKKAKQQYNLLRDVLDLCAIYY